jgi:undecaprenyl-diphosphatase
MEQMINAIILGIVEGLTEFLPVSSTGHLIFVGDLIGFESKGRVFEIAIQLGAILAILVKFRHRFLKVATTLNEKSSQNFVVNILLAFMPAMAIGVFAHSFIKAHLFSTTVVAINLVLGGIAIILIENMVKKIRFNTVDDIKPYTALKIGFFQCIAMIPGVSRSGATIMGSLLMGVERKAAAEFSFFLAVPTMLAATTYDIYKNYAVLDLSQINLILTGFFTAFVTALLVVDVAMKIITKHGFKPFAYYRIVVGALILAMM